MAGFGGGFFWVFVGSIWWWVSVLAGSVWWLDFVMVFLVVGFRWLPGFGGGWVLFDVVVVMPGFVTLSLRSYSGFTGFGCAWRPKI